MFSFSNTKFEFSDFSYKYQKLEECEDLDKLDETTFGFDKFDFESFL